MARNRSSFKMGTVEMLILFLLNQKDLYGYELCTLLSRLSDGDYILAEGSLYPILYRLLEKKYISDREVTVGKRRIRVYYRIEESGKQRLTDLLEDYRKTANGIEKILSRSLTDYEENKDDN
ncbi:MAG TPA: PadR family transcriptional regulator [Lachnospiraceae bacterium]|nr:PadR family transcriptional regulator [Lachnospiraceae bacterium]